jgi:predicted porin
MNKKLLAVAVAGALAAPVVAFAQSSVTLYGSVDVAYASKTNKTGAGGTASSVSGIGEGWQAGNRIGFRGSEDLGGGMTAQFLIENGINITRGQLFSTRAAAAGQQYDGVNQAGLLSNMPTAAYSTSTNRQSFVGLKGGWGELLGGWQYTTLYRISTLSGYFVGSEQPGGDLAHGTVDNFNYGGTRANGLVYNSPIFADGFQVTVQRGSSSLVQNESANFNAAQQDGKYQNNGKRWSIMPAYNKGPLSLALGYTRLNAQSNGAIIPAAAATGVNCLTNILGVCVTNPATTNSSNLRSRLWQFGGSYTMAGWKFMATYANGKKKDDGTTLAGVRAGTDTKSKAYQGGVEFTAGAWRPFLTLGRATVDNETGGVRTGNYKLYQFGVRYDLSKRTLLYVMHGQTKDTSVTGDAGGLRKRSGTAAGMYMSF